LAAEFQLVLALDEKTIDDEEPVLEEEEVKEVVEQS
jgi:hypothetical protein